MKAAAETVQADLLADATLQTAIAGKHYWELAPKSTKVPFVTFRIQELKRGSKDMGGDYNLSVFCFDSNLTKAAELSELVRAALLNANHRFLSGESGYTDDEAKEGFIQLNFNFNL